jgi:hypothetical protein
MRQAFAPLRRVLVRALTSEHHTMAFVPRGLVYDQTIIIFAFEDDYHFALLQSSVHDIWVRKFGATLESRGRYNVADCFDAFAFPPEEYRRMANGEWMSCPSRFTVRLKLVRSIMSTGARSCSPATSG